MTKRGSIKAPTSIRSPDLPAASRDITGRRSKGMILVEQQLGVVLRGGRQPMQINLGAQPGIQGTQVRQSTFSAGEILPGAFSELLDEHVKSRNDHKR